MTCKDCLATLRRTDWIPPEGYDSYLVEYKCENCGRIVYMPTGGRAADIGSTKKVKIFNKPISRRMDS